MVSARAGALEGARPALCNRSVKASSMSQLGHSRHSGHPDESGLPQERTQMLAFMSMPPYSYSGAPAALSSLPHVDALGGSWS